MVHLRFKVVAGVLLALSLCSSSAWAQQEDETVYVKPDDVQETPAEIGSELVFDGRLSAKASFNVVSNSNVVGQNDGTSLLLGGSILGGLDLIMDRHKVKNTLTYNTSWARTPVIAEFVKNNDSVQLESLYNYFLADWVGPYGRLSFETSVFATERVTADAETYELILNDGTTETRVTDRLQLADPLNPFELFQSVGFFVEPVRKQAIQASVRLGFGARETLTEGVLVVQDDADTANVEVTELADTIQAGAEAFVGVEGVFPAQRVDYRIGATALVPFLTNADNGRSALELTRLGFNGAITFNVLDWMGLSYDVKLLDDPQILDETQVRNSLLLTFGHTFLERDDLEKPAPTEEEEPAQNAEALAVARQAMESAEERAEEAEARAEEAEERARRAEAQVDALEDELEAAQESLDEAQEQLERPPAEPEEATEQPPEAASPEEAPAQE